VTGPHPAERAVHQPLAELMLALVTSAAVVSFSRLFVDWSFFWPLMAVVIYAHLVTMILRRRGVGIAASAIISSVGFIVLSSWLWFASTTTAGIPDASTWSAFTTAVGDAWNAFRELSAPVPVQTGFVIAAALAVFFAVFLADWAAFRLWSPVESLVPALTLFVFCTLLGSDQQRMTSAFLFCAASVAFLLVHRVARLETSSGWLTADVERGSRWLFRAGAALAVVAVVGGVVIGPRLPTANDDAWVDFREGDDGGPSSRVTISPLVDINGRLVSQSEVEVFQVESAQPAYWRLTALDTFDGEIWRSGGRYGEASGDLGAAQPEAVPTANLAQRYRIEQLGALWLPAAFQPVHIDAEGVDPRYERSSATLIVDTSLSNSDQLEYDVVSAVPTPSAEQLAAPTAPLAEDMASYVDLPPNFSRRAEATAEDVITEAGARTRYEQALALQNFFRDEAPFDDDGIEWQYSLRDVDSGHDVAAIDDFLQNRRGYCEMFAGTYAALARSIGLPARVAVGFTWGDLDPAVPNLYHVKGKHAHAWPEVWLGEDVGWIAFEPTPGRGAPNMATYANVGPEQTDGTEAGTETSVAPPTTEPSATSTTTSTPEDANLEELFGTAGSQSNANDESGPTWVVRLGVVALVLLVLVILYVAAAVAYGALRRRRRRARAVDPGERVTVAWEESLEDLELIGITHRASETHSEFAGRASVKLPERRNQLDELAMLTDFVTYAPERLADVEVDRADAAAVAIAETVQARVPRRAVWLRRLDPRQLLRAGAWRPRQQARSSNG
jgi:transglutaminase-like putative cysteine protease